MNLCHDWTLHAPSHLSSLVKTKKKKKILFSSNSFWKLLKLSLSKFIFVWNFKFSAFQPSSIQKMFEFANWTTESSVHRCTWAITELHKLLFFLPLKLSVLVHLKKKTEVKSRSVQNSLVDLNWNCPSFRMLFLLIVLQIASKIGVKFRYNDVLSVV